tara:strand:+ start:213 stop:833 length:621 start_codon:yes stop_codon:yes gene_type:complete
MGKKWLKIVYQEKNSSELKKHYRGWAEEYDSDIKDWGYAYPMQLKKIIEKQIKINRKSKILDAGCGTGYVAQTLKDLKFNNIIGLDYSKDMLRVAKSKKIYKKLICESLNRRTSLRSNQFDVILCTGVLTSGHVGPNAIKELIRLTKKNGYLILSISEAIFRKLGFKEELELRQNELKTKLISNRFVATPNNSHSAYSRMYVLTKI